MSTRDFHLLIARTLRWGVSLACLLAAFGGLLYLAEQGLAPVPDYRHFSASQAALQTDYTTLSGICSGLVTFEPNSWMQLGVCVLILTPIVRVLLSLGEYLHERDWTYVAITALVLLIIVANSLGGA